LQKKKEQIEKILALNDDFVIMVSAKCQSREIYLSHDERTIMH